MRRPLTRNERRIGALALLGLLLWAAWYLLIEIWFAGPMASLQEQMLMLEAQHQRFARALMQGPALRAELEQARQDPVNRIRLLAGDDPGAAAAELMQYTLDQVRAVADQGPGCEVTQRMPIVPEQNPVLPYRQVKVSLSLECATEPLMHLFQRFEYGQPSLFIEALSVHRTVAAPASGGPGRLKVQVLVRGYLGAAPGKEPRT